MCPSCGYAPTPYEVTDGSGCPQCGGPLQPERDQPSGVKTDFQAFGMPAPGEDDGNNGNPLGVGTIMGKDGERNFKNRDNFMGRVHVHPPLWHSASELEPDLEIPADLVDVIKEDDLPDKRKDRKLDNIEKKAFGPLLALAGGMLARPAIGAVMRAALGSGVKGKLGTLLGTGAVTHGLGKLGPGGGGAAGIGAGPAAMAAPAPSTIRPPSFYSSENDTPGSNSHIPSDDTSDPEKVDPNEHNDGDTKPLNVTNDVNGIGGTDSGLSEETTKKILDNLPHLLDWAGKPEPGKDDPILQELHNLLEGEQPGYLDDADDDHAHKALMVIVNGQGQHDQHADEKEPHDPILAKEALLQPGLDEPGSTTINGQDVKQMMAPMQGRCPQCGSTIDPGSPACAQCGSPVQSQLGQPLAASHDFMYEDTDIPPDMTVNDWNSNGRPIHCDDCGNPTVDRKSKVCQNCGGQKKIAGQGPQDDQQKAAVAQLLIDSGRQDEVPDMLTNPENYAKELAEIIGKDTPPEMSQDAQQPAPPAQPQGMPGPASDPSMGGGGGMQGMMAAINRYSDDHIQQHGDNFDNHLDVDAADQIHQEDPEAEQDSSHTWTDEQGQPLKVGQEYEMYSKQYDVPDIIRIEQVKPDSITYTLTGEYGLEHQTEIAHQEAQIEGVTFSPIGQNHPDEAPGGLEQNMDDDPRPAPGEQTDLSTPHSLVSSARDWLKEGGASFTPREQREFIEEAGVARNADKLNLAGTHYESSRSEVDEDYFLFGL